MQSQHISILVFQCCLCTLDLAPRYLALHCRHPTTPTPAWDVPVTVIVALLMLLVAWHCSRPVLQGFPEKAMSKLEDYGFIQSKTKGEYHANNQTMSKLLHKAIGLGSGSKADPSAYEAYMAHFESAPPHVLRDCLALDTGKGPISVDEVEPAEEIMRRFCTGGMSLGAISREVRSRALCCCWKM